MCSSHPIHHIERAGFTLVELLVVIAVLAIVATVGIPNFGPTVANSRATAAANGLLGALQLARSEAVRLNEPVLITPTGGNWAAGWTITRPGTGTTIRQREALARITITGGPANIAFGSAGNANPAPSFTIVSNGASRCLIVTASGSAAVNPGGC
jgi:type IV fimbrial biogenesis protein FimT